MSTQKAIDPRLVEFLKYTGFFLVAFGLVLFIVFLLAPYGNARAQDYENRVLQRITLGQELQGPFDLADPDFPQFFQGFLMEDGRTVLVIQSQHNHRPMNIGIRYSTTGVPEVLHPLDSPLFGRMRYFFRDGRIPTNFHPSMGSRILNLYHTVERGIPLVLQGFGNE